MISFTVTILNIFIMSIEMIPKILYFYHILTINTVSFKRSKYYNIALITQIQDSKPCMLIYFLEGRTVSLFIFFFFFRLDVDAKFQII